MFRRHYDDSVSLVMADHGIITCSSYDWYDTYFRSGAYSDCVKFTFNPGAIPFSLIMTYDNSWVHLLHVDGLDYADSV